jgi:hypothetical protein
VFTVGWHGSPIKFEEQCVHCCMVRFTNKVWRIMCSLLDGTLLLNPAIQQWTHYSSNFIGEPCHITVDTLFFKLYWWNVPSNSEHIILQTLLVNRAIQQSTQYSSNFIGEPQHATVNTLFFKLYWWTVPSNPIKFEEYCVDCWMARFTNNVWRIMCALLDGTFHQ